MAPIKKHRLDNLLSEVQATIAFDQPLLTATLQTNGILVSGTYALNPTTDQLLGQGPIARYQVSIHFPSAFPEAAPVVFETGDTIPHDADHHINQNGSCCVVIWEVWASSTKRVSVQDYFDRPFRNFFLGQYQKATTGKWPFGEERHGKAGLVDAFAERLSCANDEEEVLFFLRLLSQSWPKGYRDCPCGSGKIVRKCCAERLARLVKAGRSSALAKEVPKRDAQRMLSRLRSYDR